MSEAFAVRGRIITPDQIIVDGAVIVEGEEIVWMGEATQAAASGYGHQIAVAPSPTDGRYIMPGLVDVHCHGGGGQSFPDAPTKEDAMTAVWEHRLHGTTTLVASLATDSPQALRRQAQMLADLADAQEIAGIHFEGPFISAGHCGAQNPDTIQAPNPALVRELLIVTRGHTVSMTLAPEGKRAFGSGSVTEALIEGGAIPSFGHTSCSAAQMREAAQWTREKLGMTPVKRSSRYTVTHLFNGMAPFHHREPGPVLEMLADAASGGAVAAARQIPTNGDHLGDGVFPRHHGKRTVLVGHGRVRRPGRRRLHVALHAQRQGGHHQRHAKIPAVPIDGLIGSRRHDEFARILELELAFVLSTGVHELHVAHRRVVQQDELDAVVGRATRKGLAR